MTRTDALVIWGVLAGLVVAVEALSHLSGRRVGGFAALGAPLLARRPTRLLLVLGWMWLGWHFFAR